MYEMNNFITAIDDMHIFLVKSVSGSFTWSNKDGLLSKIDHGFGNSLQHDKFLDCAAKFFPGGLSDHSPMVINTNDLTCKKKAPFKVFNHLFNNSEFSNVVTHSWGCEVPFHGVGGVWAKFKKVKANLKTLHLNMKNKIADKVYYWRAILHDAHNSNINANPGLLGVEKDAYIQFKKWLYVENSILAQKSRIT